MLSFDELSGAQAKGISDIHPYHGKRQSTKRLPHNHKEIHPSGEVDKAVHEAPASMNFNSKRRIPTESGRTRHPCKAAPRVSDPPVCFIPKLKGHYE